MTTNGNASAPKQPEAAQPFKGTADELLSRLDKAPRGSDSTTPRIPNISKNPAMYAFIPEHFKHLGVLESVDAHDNEYKMALLDKKLAAEGLSNTEQLDLDARQKAHAAYLTKP